MVNMVANGPGDWNSKVNVLSEHSTLFFMVLKTILNDSLLDVMNDDQYIYSY